MRRCEFCGAELRRKPAEWPARFARRRFCGHACAHWKPDVCKRAHHYRANRFRKDYCEWDPCCKARRLHVHHIDGDWTNNAPANLQTLCRKHHIKAHGRRTWAENNRALRRAA